MRHLRAVINSTVEFLRQSRMDPAIRKSAASLTEKFQHKSNYSLPARPFRKTAVSVVELDTFEAARREIDALVAQGRTDPKVMAANFANNFDVGGGYKRGCRAQEEDLFRSSTLPCVLDNQTVRALYPINPQHTDAYALYSEDVRILRKGPADGYAYLAPAEVAKYKVQVCSIAAFNAHDKHGRDAGMFQQGCPRGTQCPFTPDGFANTRKRIEVQFQMAIEKGSDVLIVGAFGCGAFYNEPNAIISMYREMLAKYDGHIQKVVFAIIGKPNFNAFHSAIIRGLPCPVVSQQSLQPAQDPLVVTAGMVFLAFLLFFLFRS